MKISITTNKMLCTARLILTTSLMVLIMNFCCPCNRANIRFSPPTSKSFPLLEISGDYQEIGYAIGSFFKKEIQLVLTRRKSWLQKIRTYSEKDPDQLAQHLQIQAETHYPHLMEELRGMSRGAEIPFQDLFLLNIHAEMSAKLASETRAEIPGCSTIYWNSRNRKLLFHNEDGHQAYRDLMFMVKATLPSGVTVLTLTYPGFLMGNGPSLNNHGIFQTTNFISGKHCRPGIPRYFLGRAVLEAKSLKEAIEIVTRPERAIAYHHNLGSLTENKIYSVEVTPNNHQIVEPGHLYFHTNHLILDKTKATPQDMEYVRSSSLPRYETISDSLQTLTLSGGVQIKNIKDILSSHSRSPYSPCRHPRGEVKGITLATALIDIHRGTLSIYRGNPCHAFPNQKVHEYSIRNLKN